MNKFSEKKLDESVYYSIIVKSDIIKSRKKGSVGNFTHIVI